MALESKPSEILHAAALYRPLRRASRLAQTSGASVMIAGTVLVAGQSLWDVSTWPAGIVLLGLGASEWRTGADLLRADPGAPTRLALHQLGVFVTVLLFAVAHELLVDDIAPGMPVGLAVSVLTSAVIQGIVAMYYLSRRRLLARFRDATDSWVRELMALETT
jgi:hypothetical protein